MNLTPAVIRALASHSVDEAHIVRLQIGIATRDRNGKRETLELRCQNGARYLHCDICGHGQLGVTSEGRTTLDDRCERCDSHFIMQVAPREGVCRQQLSARFTSQPDGATHFHMECPRCQTFSTYTLPPARDKSTAPTATALGSTS